METSYSGEFVDEKRSDGEAYLFHHLEPSGHEADIGSFNESVEELLRKMDLDEFWASREGNDLRFSVLGEMLGLILSDDWGYV